MAQLGMQFDATQVDPNGGMIVPEGKYTAYIVSSEMKTTKEGTGQYLQLEIELIDGPFAGRKVYDRLNLQNQNEQTVAIAQRSLSQICHAVGELSVTDSEQLHARRLVIDVRIEKGKGTYRDQNRVFCYEPPDGRVPVQEPGQYQPQPQPQPQQAQPAAAAAPSRVQPPWRARA